MAQKIKKQITEEEHEVDEQEIEEREFQEMEAEEQTIIKPKIKKLDPIPSYDRPQVDLESVDGNVFSLIGLVSKELKKAGFKAHAKEMSERATSECDSYEEVLVLFTEYISIM